MARKTAAERRAEADRAREETERAFWAVFQREYASRFANLMFDFMMENRLQVNRINENTFEFSRPTVTGCYRLTVTPPAQYSWDYLSAFEDAEDLVKRFKAEREEELRQSQLRINALAKLSADERKVLGLT